MKRLFCLLGGHCSGKTSFLRCFRDEESVSVIPLSVVCPTRFHDYYSSKPFITVVDSLDHSTHYTWLEDGQEEASERIEFGFPIASLLENPSAIVLVSLGASFDTFPSFVPFVRQTNRKWSVVLLHAPKPVLLERLESTGCYSEDEMETCVHLALSQIHHFRPGNDISICLVHNDSTLSEYRHQAERLVLEEKGMEETFLIPKQKVRRYLNQSKTRKILRLLLSLCLSEFPPNPIDRMIEWLEHNSDSSSTASSLLDSQDLTLLFNLYFELNPFKQEPTLTPDEVMSWGTTWMGRRPRDGIRPVRDLDLNGWKDWWMRCQDDGESVGDEEIV